MSPRTLSPSVPFATAMASPSGLLRAFAGAARLLAAAGAIRKATTLSDPSPWISVALHRHDEAASLLAPALPDLREWLSAERLHAALSTRDALSVSELRRTVRLLSVPLADGVRIGLSSSEEDARVAAAVAFGCEGLEGAEEVLRRCGRRPLYPSRMAEGLWRFAIEALGVTGGDSAAAMIACSNFVCAVSPSGKAKKAPPLPSLEREFSA